MFWIIGGDSLFKTLAALTHWKWAAWWGGSWTTWSGRLSRITTLYFHCSCSSPCGHTLCANGKAGGGVPKRICTQVIRRAALLVFLGLIITAC